MMNKFSRRALALLLAGAMMLPLPAQAANGDMSVATFRAKADALRKKGPMALLSSDVGLLKREVQDAGRAYRAGVERQRAEGKPPHSCLPAKTSVTSNELMAHLATYSPEAGARTTMRDAIGTMMARKYPCK